MKIVDTIPKIIFKSVSGIRAVCSRLQTFLASLESKGACAHKHLAVGETWSSVGPELRRREGRCGALSTDSLVSARAQSQGTRTQGQPPVLGRTNRLVTPQGQVDTGLHWAFLTPPPEAQDGAEQD